jgi:hypothetical protein
MGIEGTEQMNLWKTLAAILHLGNIGIAADRSDQARIPDLAQAELACHVLGIPLDSFVKALLNPRVRAGREWVNQSRTKLQAIHSLDALAKALYEKSFGYLVEGINQSMERPSIKTSFIGVLDIAGFEIFQVSLELPLLMDRQIVLNNCALIIPMRSCSNSLTIICLFLNRRSMHEKISSGSLSILAMIYNLLLISSRSPMYRGPCILLILANRFAFSPRRRMHHA